MENNTDLYALQLKDKNIEVFKTLHTKALKDKHMKYLKLPTKAIPLVGSQWQAVTLETIPFWQVLRQEGSSVVQEKKKKNGK